MSGKEDFEMMAYARLLQEQGVWDEGCALMTCGPSTGHFVRPVAFCDRPETAIILAAAFAKASAGRNAKRQDPKGLGPKDEHAVGEAETPEQYPHSPREGMER